MASGSCCQAKIFPSRSRTWPGAARSVKELCLPPSCHMIWPGAPVHLEYGPGVPRAHQQVAVGVEVDGVDVEPVPGRARRGRPRHVAVGVGHVAGAVPLEQHLAGLDVDLLDDAVDDLLVGGAADGGQVRGRRGIGDDQRRVPGRDEELVEVGGVPVGRPDGGDLLVTVVVDVVGAVGAVRADLKAFLAALLGSRVGGWA